MDSSQLPLDCILTGDCREILATLPDNLVDLVFADPPYNLQLKQELYRPNNTRVNGVSESWDQFESFEAYDHFSREWLNACRRVLKDSGTLWVIGTYHNIYRLGTILQDLDYWILNDVVWIKTNPMPNFRGVRFTNAQETLIWAQKRRGASYTFNHQDIKALNGDLQMRSDWFLPLCTGKERIKVNGSKAHATQKPEMLLYRVILSSTKPGDVILDPFFGTGTTGAVAKKLHRRWIGIERDAKYVEIARQRIEMIEPGSLDEVVFEPRQKRRQERLPFGRLLECGLLLPGQRLYFDRQEEAHAVVLANGHIRYQDMSGSIHQVARAIQQTPCNGWEHWYFEDTASGNLEAIDTLRQKLRE
jgi:site-specific DNA-methyltransferase (adenine-specific)